MTEWDVSNYDLAIGCLVAVLVGLQAHANVLIARRNVLIARRLERLESRDD